MISEMSVLDNVQQDLPPLALACRLDSRAAEEGFDWPSAAAAFDKCREELEEVSEAIAQSSSAAIAEEIGDLLFSIATLARHAGVDAEKALSDANLKFRRRISYIEARCREDGLTFQEAGMHRLASYWREVRTAENL